MYKHLFKKYNLEDLYVGIVTIFRPHNKYPPEVVVEVPKNKEKISYITILEKQEEDVYVEIDKDQTCFSSFSNKEYSNFPIATQLVPLKKFYRAAYGRKKMLLENFLTQSRYNKIVNDAQKKCLVIGK